MLAESRDPKPIGSEAQWKSSIIVNNKHPRNENRHQRHASGQRSSFLGLETKTELVWEDWDVGREFTKSLVLKNIGLKIQKLQLRPPVSKFFTMSVSRIIAVSPGTTLSIPVTFRPSERCAYDDSIEFHGKSGSFQVFLRAIIPYPALEVPDTLLLPLCAVHQSASTTFQLKNLSKLHTYFKWDCSEPFQVNPAQGVLKPSDVLDITVLFKPQAALLFHKHAYCSFGEKGGETNSCCTVLLQGVAKYPCLHLRRSTSKGEKDSDDSVINFGSVPIGKSAQKCFDIYNSSHVTAFFSLTRLSGGVPLLGSEFTCDISSSNVGPGETVSAQVTFAPMVADAVSVEYLTVECKGALNKTALKLTGSCEGPKVSLSSSVVDFGCIKEGATASKTIDMINYSCAEATYQWDLDCAGHSVFSIRPQCGTIQQQSSVTLAINYLPTMPIACHRSIPCFIHHGEPLFLDLIGTCHSGAQEPDVLTPEHLSDSKKDQSDMISASMPSYSTYLDESSRQPDGSSVFSSTPRDNDKRCSVEVDSLLSRSPSSSTHVSVVPSELLFHHSCSSLSSSLTPSQAVAITNYTTVKITLVWTIAQDSPFSVSPITCDLSPLKSTSFRVTYNPKELNTLHGAQLECMAVKQPRSDEEEKQICLPWCVIVSVIGDSFEYGKEHFYPCCSLEPNKVVFAGQSFRSCQTVLLRNNGDQPLTFCRNLNYSSDPALVASVLLVPKCGLVQPGNHQILTVITTPKEDTPIEGLKLILQLNGAKHKKEITVFSMVEKVGVSLEGGGHLYFQDISVGSHTERTHFIRNICRLPLCFQWSIPESDHNVISVQPDAGKLQPNESLLQSWSFRPMEEKTYTLEPSVLVWPVNNPEWEKSIIPLKVVGTGSRGFIQAVPGVVHLEDTLVGCSQSIDVPLVNNSNCSVCFILFVEQTIQNEETQQDPEPEKCTPTALQLDRQRGNMASRSTVMLRATFRPDRQALYQWTISYVTLNRSGVPLSSPQPVCEIRAKGVFPKLQVTDTCSGGIVAWLNKTFVWELFSVDSLNEQLLSIPYPVEHTYRSPAKHSMRTYPTILIKAMLDFNFCSAPLNSEPSTFVLVFYNPGCIPVEWTFLFPEDQQVDFRHWTHSEELCNNELHQMKVVELFNISPRSGMLLSGQQRAVQFSYSHVMIGTHQLPIILKISHGREILLHFQGVTVDQETPYLYFLSRHHVFTPVMIGDLTPPVQMYDLYNGGDIPVRYEVDAHVLSQLQENSFNHALLSCLNPVGDIPPGKVASLEFIFSPLEAKMHSMDIPIHIQDGDTTLIRFDGCGLSPQTVFTSSDTKLSLPCVRRIPLPGLGAAFLSQDSVSIGDIPVCSQSSRVIFLTNVSLKEILYKWNLTQVVHIYPEQGLLHPGESILCVLTFKATDYPTIYRLDITCQLTQQAAWDQYYDALERLAQEQEKQKNEFTITDTDLAESRRVFAEKVPATAVQTKGLSLCKHKTLPPICSKIARAEQQMQSDPVKVWKRPEPPRPTLLHLLVTARSYRSQEYLRHFPEQFNNHFRCFLSTKPLRPKKTMLCDARHPDEHPSPTHGPERNFLEHVITSVLWTILDDEAFTRPLLSLASKTLTYNPRISSSSPVPTPQPQTGLEETTASSDILHSQVDNMRSAECFGTRLEMKADTQRVPAAVCNDILLNTLQNLMTEAVRGEFNFTEPSRTDHSSHASARRHSSGKVRKDETDREKIQNEETQHEQQASPSA
ncbi:cilia- and flagella-associated protein 65 isoform X2 [Dunckerocampus dactyliophorus]|uniref:cilia- and flagella-associated protein 65 isoform X2 n=1 Tax=Dunckerocampus dactyliophorus TaxID=161453 RepID=UPI0024062C7C|nr:cilia- and flagella-associated protein 65 isoform X2 [Dunckerocampus dactyliophorus]